MLPELIETRRLHLRAWSFGDLADLLAYVGDEEYGRYLPLPRPYREADGLRFIATQILLDRSQQVAWAIAHEGRVVGGINIRLLAAQRLAEIGYSIARPFWGRGLGVLRGEWRAG